VTTDLRPTNTLTIDPERLWHTLEVSAGIGPGKAGGLSRLTLSDDDKAMRDQFVTWCQDAGCTVTVDPVGNIFARREGRDPELTPVVMGSHLDTQIAGGRYDGILGVLSGLEVIRTLNDRDIRTRRPIEVVCWTNEEGVRFQPPMMGAGVFAGVHDLNWVLSQTDDAGLTFGDEVARIGYAGSVQRDAADIDAYFELHIEQGPILDAQKVPVGIVTGGFTSFGAELEIAGENAHSGPTPMAARKDALVGAALIVARLHEIGWGYAPEGRATCARLDVSPNRYGIIADQATVVIDVRHPDPDLADEMFQKALHALPDVAERSGTDVSKVKDWSFGDVAFDAGLIDLIQSTARDLDVAHIPILSAAGHDAYHLSRIAPTAMIFTPCVDGITHNENEDIELASTVPGVNVLLHAVLRRANA
jgi:N-carbamoyl-L-amino-acid hydrolase